MTTTPVQGHPLMANSTASYSPITPMDLEAHSIFSTRHIGPREHDAKAMLESIGLDSLDALIDQVVPADIRLDGDLDLPAARTSTSCGMIFKSLRRRTSCFDRASGWDMSGRLRPV